LEKISRGIVLIPLDTIKRETVTLSNDVKKAKRAPESMDDLIKGSVIFQKTLSGLAPSIIAALSNV
jgi:hypothetical protein